MRKYLAMMCAAMLCVCCLALGACSGSSSSSAAASSSASASASAASSSASAQASFEGTWKLAAVEAEGITMAGDFSSIIGTEDGMALTIKADGTGEMKMNEDTTAFTWTQKDATTITMTPQADDESASSASAEAESASAESASAESASAEASSASAEAAEATSIDIVMKDGALFMTMNDDSFSGTAIFTTDGVYVNAKEISAAAMTAISSEDALIGTWTLSGMSMMGISMYGDAKDLAAMAGGQDMSLVFEKDGKCTLMGSEATYAIDADGAAIVEGDTKVPVKALGDEIAIDMTDIIGMDMIMVFSK